MFRTGNGEALMAEKNVFGDCSPPPPLSKVWMTGPPLSQGLDPALLDTKYHKILQTLSLNTIQCDDFL